MSSETAQSTTQPLQFENYTILIIDDSTANLGVVFETLDSLGFELMIAQDGESGLSKAEYEQPDIILLDAIMPGVDGFEVCRTLKNNALTKDIPVIFMTGLTSVEDTVHGFEAGAVDYITKPIRQQELVARLLNHLSIRSLTQQLQKEISDRKSAAQALLDYQNKLEEMVTQRTSELTEANIQLRSLATRLSDVEETERQKLARELHDRVGQDLGLLNVQLNIIKQEIPAELANQLATRFDDMLNLVSRVAANVHDVTSELRSPVLEEYGIIAALNWHGSQFTERTGVRVMVSGDEKTGRPSRTIENTLLRISQEALANIAKYAQASLVSMSVEQDNKVLRLTIKDDGVGFVVGEWQTPTDQGRGWGILSMRERAESIGGRLEIASKPGEGTQVSVEVPR
jgi:signal transduction histidine kinase